MSSQRQVSLGEIAQFQEGYVNPPQSESQYFGGPIKWLRAVDLNNSFVFATSRTLTEDGYRSAGKSAYLFPPDTLAISKSGTIGRLGLLKDWMCGNRAVINIRPVSSLADTRYVLYALLSDPAQIDVLAEGSVQRNLYVSQLATFRMPLPELGEQKRVVQTLGPLDDKIELNRKMNETLEAMARAIFKDWFVDFGPTRAKAEGRAPYLASELWDLFPDALDDEGTPVGWEGKPLDEVAEFLNGLALQKFPATHAEDSLPVIKIAELRGGVTAKSSRATREVPEKYVVKDGDFLFSWSGSLLAKFWTEGEGALNQHLFKVSSERYPAWFFSLWVHHHLEEFQAIAASKATTMGHIQRGHLREAMTSCPPDDVLSTLGLTIGPLVERTIRNELESRTLAQSRDLLLPKLMSGEIRLREAGKAVEAVA